MFHVEHYRVAGVTRRRSVLVMEPEQKHNTKDNGRQKNLADVIVQHLLVRGGGVAEDRFFLIRRLTRNNGID